MLSRLRGKSCWVLAKDWLAATGCLIRQPVRTNAGRVEFTAFFPENTQGVLVQPIGTEGVLIAGTDTQRGFGFLDQVMLPVAALASNGNKSQKDRSLLAVSLLCRYFQRRYLGAVGADK